jgi:hypothetical protein
VQRNSGQTSLNAIYHVQTVETVNAIPFAGKNITMSFYARAGSNYSAASNVLNSYLNYGTGTDQNLIAGFTGNAGLLSLNATLTTTWQRFTTSATLPSTATEFGLGFYYTPVGTAGTNDYFEVTGVQIDIGSVALPFRTYAATYQGELAACQRYLPAVNNYAVLNGYAYGTSQAIYAARFNVQARVAPTGITTSGTINTYALNAQSVVTPTFNIGSVDSASILANFTIVAGQGSRIEMQSNALILFTGCEL